MAWRNIGRTLGAGAIAAGAGYLTNWARRKAFESTYYR